MWNSLKRINRFYSNQNGGNKCYQEIVTDAGFSGNAMLALEEQKKATKSCAQMEPLILLMKQAYRQIEKNNARFILLFRLWSMVFSNRM
jgi:hypothetical protein